MDAGPGTKEEDARFLRAPSVHRCQLGWGRLLRVDPWVIMRCSPGTGVGQPPHLLRQLRQGRLVPVRAGRSRRPLADRSRHSWIRTACVAFQDLLVLLVDRPQIPERASSEGSRRRSGFPAFNPRSPSHVPMLWAVNDNTTAPAQFERGDRARVVRVSGSLCPRLEKRRVSSEPNGPWGFC